MNERLPAFHLGYQRSLDGLRGMAIAMVLLCHGHILGNGFGFVGVNTFFVLSGFLITSLLVAEWDRSKAINFRDFYIRRALRLLPALGVMLIFFAIFVAITAPAGHRKSEVLGILAALFYFTNWAQIFSVETNPFLGHTWSLSVEEQFYIIWPILLLLLLRKHSRASILCWIFLGAVLSISIRFFLSTGTDIANSNPNRLTFSPDTRADSLLLGCLAGVAVSSNLLPHGNWFKKFLNATAAISLAGLIILATFQTLTPWMICFGWGLTSVFAMILILCPVLRSGLLRSVFESPVLVQTGRISYGLYLWHYPILLMMQQHNWPWQHLAYLLVVVPVALASYYFVERPCLRLKNSFVHAR